MDWGHWSPRRRKHFDGWRALRFSNKELFWWTASIEVRVVSICRIFLTNFHIHLHILQSIQLKHDTRKNKNRYFNIKPLSCITLKGVIGIPLESIMQYYRLVPKPGWSVYRNLEISLKINISIHDWKSKQLCFIRYTQYVHISFWTLGKWLYERRK